MLTGFSSGSLTLLQFQLKYFIRNLAVAFSKVITIFSTYSLSFAGCVSWGAGVYFQQSVGRAPPWTGRSAMWIHRANNHAAYTLMPNGNLEIKK